MVKPDEIIRSNRKTLAITIDGNNRLIVRAPYRCGEERIFAFLNSKEDWILRKRAEKAAVGIVLPPQNLHGYELLLLGEKCKIFLTETDKIGYDEQQSCIYLPLKNAEVRLKKWLKENALRIFTSVVERKSAQMGVAYKSVTVTSARSRWGSCSFDNALRFSFRLLYAPKEIIEYVAVHELSHVRYKNHSKAFWTEVEKYVPDWKIKRNWLKKHGGLMGVF